MAQPERLLSTSQAKRFYDRFGARQDKQIFYEGPALDQMLSHLALNEACAVLEFGCGTGRLAAEMLSAYLPDSARYLGLDVSTTMARLARDRTALYGMRARIQQTDGMLQIRAATGAFDRVVCTYVLDLMSDDAIAVLLDEFHRVLKPGGLMGLVGITPGNGGVARLVSGVWRGLHRLSPKLVGGCRPIQIARRLDLKQWKLHHHRTVAPYNITSEVLVAQRPA